MRRRLLLGALASRGQEDGAEFAAEGEPILPRPVILVLIAWPTATLLTAALVITRRDI